MAAVSSGAALRSHLLFGRARTRTPGDPVADAAPDRRGAWPSQERKRDDLVKDERAMAVAIGGLPRVDPRACRTWVSRHCGADVVAACERAYRAVAARDPRTALAHV